MNIKLAIKDKIWKNKIFVITLAFLLFSAPTGDPNHAGHSFPNLNYIWKATVKYKKATSDSTLDPIFWIKGRIRVSSYFHIYVWWVVLGKG